MRPDILTSAGGRTARWIGRLSTTPDTGYGSTALERACRAREDGDAVSATGLRARWERARISSLPLARYRRWLPRLDVELTESPLGLMIGEHLAIRRQSDGGYRFRDAQSILPIPATISEYLRGRRRQAVRTNVRHANARGFIVIGRCELTWVPGLDDTRHAHLSPGPVEKWMVLGADGVVVADSILSVDDEVALLHGLVSFAPYARWLLHTAIVERLCGECRTLLVNCDDAYLTSPEVQYFQRRLGYDVARLRVRQPRLARGEGKPQRARQAATRVSGQPAPDGMR